MYASGSSVFLVVPVAAEVLQPLRDDAWAGTEAVEHHAPQREEPQVEVEREPVGPLSRHDDDQPPAGHPPQFGDRPVHVEHVLQCVRADDGVDIKPARCRLRD